MDALILPQSLSKKEQSQLQQFLYRDLLYTTLLFDDNLTSPQLFGKMAALSKKARYAVNGEGDEERINQLLHFFYQEQGFQCKYNDYFHSDNLMLNKVLERKQGMTVSLGALLLQLAHLLDLPLYPVNFPAQMILRADITLASGRRERRYINLWNGEYFTFEELEKLLEADEGAYNLPRYLKVADITELEERLAMVWKMTLTQEKRFSDILTYIETRLMANPDDPFEIRDRGMILASMECYQAAIEDLNYFIDQCPDDPSAMLLKMEMPALEKEGKSFVIH